jgi:nucleoside-diphosphate-sugar epimerase
MRVLVTGAAGGVGGYVMDALGADAEVVGFDRVKGADRDGVEWVTGDILSVDALVEAMRGCDAIVHLAGVPIYAADLNLQIANVNVVGAATVMEAAVRAEVPRLVQASSICATGFIFWSSRRTPAWFPVDETYADQPDDMYGLSKLFDEQLAASYEQRYGLETTSYRMATVWVPDHAPTDEWLGVLLDEENDSHLEYRDLRWQYVDARDVAQAFALGVRHERGLGVCNVGAAESPGDAWRIWVEDLYPDVTALREPGAFLADRTKPLWSIDRLAELAGYAPQHTWREYPVFVEAWERYLQRRGAVSARA